MRAYGRCALTHPTNLRFSCVSVLCVPFLLFSFQKAAEESGSTHASRFQTTTWGDSTGKLKKEKAD